MIRRHRPPLEPSRSTLMRHSQSPALQPAAQPARAAGFTLIEIMVVVVIIGLLAAAIVPQVVGRVEEARVAKAKEDIQALTTALTMYRIDNFQLPTTDQGLQALVERPSDPSIKHWRPGGYVQQGSLKDPWGNDYQYVFPGTHGHDFDLFSYGSNGTGSDEGGDSSTVIGNWNLDTSGTSGASDQSGAGH
jgi:general secretion pathway protein G